MKDATDSVGKEMITTRAMDDVEGVRLQALNPLPNFGVVELLVTAEKPDKGSVVNEYCASAVGKVDVEG